MRRKDILFRAGRRERFNRATHSVVARPIRDARDAAGRDVARKKISKIDLARRHARVRRARRRETGRRWGIARGERF
jgi:hypothetical protein